MSKFIKKSFTVLTVVANMVWTMGVASFVPTAHAAVTSGSLIKGSLPAVYYMGADGKRYVFPNEKTYFTWYPNFAGVQTITDLELAGIQIGGNVTFRPGVKLVKIQSDPKVYAIAAGGTLRWVTTAAIATCLYGSNWDTAFTQDISDAFFVNYKMGADITACSQFNPAAETAAATSINVDKGLTGGTVPPVGTGGALILSLASDSPAGQSVPAGATPATNVVFAKINFTAGSSAVAVSRITITRSGLSADADLLNIKLWNGATQLDTAQTLNSSHTATFNVALNIAANTTTTVTVTGDLAANNSTSSEVKLGIAANTSVVSNASSVMGAPVFGNTMVLSNVSVGSLTITKGAAMPAVGATVDLGKTDTFFAFKLTAGSVEDVSVWSITLKSGNYSTINSGDIENIQLINDTTGATVATLANLNSNGDAIFDLGSSPIILAKGTSRDFILKAKVVNGSSRVIAFDINDGVSYLVKATGNLYGFGVSYLDGTVDWDTVAAGNQLGIGTGVTINQGTVTVSKASTSPAAGNIGIGVSDANVAEFTYDILGETVRFGTTAVDLNVVSAVAGNCSNILDNVKLVNKATGEVLAGPVTPTGTIAGGVCLATFSSSYELPAGLNTVQVLVNTSSTIVTGNTVLAELKAGSFANVRGLTSNRTITTVAPGVDVPANMQTVKGATLIAQIGATPIAGNVVAGKNNFNVAYIGLDASSGGEDIRVSQIRLTEGTGGVGGDAGDDDYVSAKLINVATGAQVGQTVQPSTTNNTLTFSFAGDELVVSKTAQVNLALQINVLSTADAGQDFSFEIAATTDVTGTGKSSATAADTSATIINVQSPFQNIVASGTLQVELDPDTAVSAQLVSSSTSNGAVSYKFTAFDEAVDVTEIFIVAVDPTNTANQAANWGSDAASIDVYVNGVKVNAAPLAAAANGIQKLAVPAGTITVPKSGSVVVTVKVNMQTKDNITSGDMFQVGIADNSVADGSGYGTAWTGAGNYLVTATGQDSGTAITTIADGSGNVYGGNTMSAHDGVLTVTLNASSPSGLKVAATNQELIRATLTATGDNITVDAIDFNTSTTCVLAGAVTTKLKSGDGVTTYSTTGAALAAGAGTFTVFSPVLSITAGSYKIVKIEGDTTGCTNNNTLQVNLVDGANTSSGVSWHAVDGIVIGNNAWAVAGGPVTRDLPLSGGAMSY